MTVREPPHFAYVDAIRGYAFLGVLFSHCAFSFVYFHFNWLFKSGGCGVQLFFLASAITLYYSMSARHTGQGLHAFNFYLRRLFRIAPLYWLSMIFYWSVPDSLQPNFLGMWAPDGVHKSYFLLNALFLHGWFPYMFNSIVPGGWSIAVEMTFYLVFPFCFFFIKNLRTAFLWVLGGFFFTIVEMYAYHKWHIHIWPNVLDGRVINMFGQRWFPSQFTIFLIGIFTYFLLKDEVVAPVSKSQFWSCSLMALCLMVLVVLWKIGESLFLPTQLLIALALAGTVISIAGNKVPYAITPAICYLGKLSYSCYLTHFFALALVTRFLETTLSSHLILRFPLDTGHSVLNFLLFIVMSLATLVLTVIFSTITHHLVENPGIALGRWVIQRLHTRD
jgi:peptidoglycan/LPS O-acetylase OafA/YrhL